MCGLTLVKVMPFLNKFHFLHSSPRGAGAQIHYDVHDVVGELHAIHHRKWYQMDRARVMVSGCRVIESDVEIDCGVIEIRRDVAIDD